MQDRRDGTSEQGWLPGRPTPVRDSGGPRPFSGKWVGGGPNSALRIWLQVWYVVRSDPVLDFGLRENDSSFARYACTLRTFSER